MKKYLSIVVPVYNVEKYLDKCINSILSQDYKDFELILVDDGSTDKSGKMCDEWAEKDSRIVIYHKDNGGLMSAWKYGVNRANGKYVGFVDSDDWIENDMFSVLLNEALKNDSDVVTCGFLKDFGNGIIYKEKQLISGGNYNEIEIKSMIFPILISSGTYPPRAISPNRWTKLFRRELLIKSLPYCNEDVSIGEDLVITFSTLQKVKKLTVISNFFPYHYVQHSSSMINAYSDKKYEKLKILNYTLNTINDESSYDFSNQICNDYINLLMQQIESEILFSGKKRMDIIVSMMKEFHEDVFQNAVKNCDSRKLSKKQKLYLILVKYKMYSLFIFIRKSVQNKNVLWRKNG